VNAGYNFTGVLVQRISSGSRRVFLYVEPKWRWGVGLPESPRFVLETSTLPLPNAVV
jgi:hypothetical protein